MARHLLQNYSLQWVIATLKANLVLYRTNLKQSSQFCTAIEWF